MSIKRKLHRNAAKACINGNPRALDGLAFRNHGKLECGLTLFTKIRKAIKNGRLEIVKPSNAVKAMKKSEVDYVAAGCGRTKEGILKDAKNYLYAIIGLLVIIAIIIFKILTK